MFPTQEITKQTVTSGMTVNVYRGLVMRESLGELQGRARLALRFLASDARADNKEGRQNSSIDFEKSLQPLLSVVLKAPLRNLNEIDPRQPAIDLGNEDAGICVQVTTRRDVKNKLEDTLDAFRSMKGREAYRTLLVLFVHEENKPTYRKKAGDPDVMVWNLDDLVAEVGTFKRGEGFDLLHLSEAVNLLTDWVSRLLVRKGYFGSHVLDVDYTTVKKAKDFQYVVSEIARLPHFERTLRRVEEGPNWIVPGRLAKTIESVMHKVGYSWDSDNPYWANNLAFRVRQEEIRACVISLHSRLTKVDLHGKRAWNTIDNDLSWPTYLRFGDGVAALTEEESAEVDRFAQDLSSLFDLLFENQWFIRDFRARGYPS